MIRRMYRLLFGCLLLSITGHAQQSSPSITVTGTGAQPLLITAADLAQMPRATATTTNGGVETRFEGDWLYEILKKAGVQFGEALRGKALITCVLAEVHDGYEVVFSVGEVNPPITEGQILLADKANDKPLSGDNGAFRISAARDKRAGRSISMLTKLEIVQLRK